MTTDVQPAADAPLSMEGAMGILAARRQPETTEAPAAPEAPAPEAEELESEVLPETEDAPDPDEPAIEGDETEELESDPEQPVIAAPKSWAASERAEFAKLSPRAQEIILARETERDAAVSRALNEAGTAKSQAETQALAKVQAELSKVAELHTTLSTVVTQAQTAFAGKWDNVDWVAFARQDPQAYTIARAEFEADVGALQRTQQAANIAAQAKQESERQELQNYVRTESAKLATVEPELADPKEGPVRLAKVGQFLLKAGIPAETIERISAEAASIAYDAMRYREGKARLAPTPKPKATPAPAPAAAAPTAAPARPTRQRTAETARATLREKGTMEAALAVMRARRG